MKRYEIPNVKIARFDVEDIITNSGMIVSSGDLTGASAEMYEIYKENSVAKNNNVSVFTW